LGCACAFAVIAGQAQPREIQGAVEHVMREFGGREELSGLGGDFPGEKTHGLCFVLVAGEDFGGEVAPLMEAFAVGGEVASGVVGEGEVGQKEPPGMKLRDSVERSVPEFKRDIGRRSREKNKGMAFDADSSGIADEGDVFQRIEIGDVVGSVAWRIEHAKLVRAHGNGLAAVEGTEIRGGDGKKIAIEALHLVAIKAQGAV
jgi:hypothetical protein